MPQGMDSWKITIEADISVLKEQLSKAQAELDGFTNGDHTVKLDIDTKSLDSAMKNLDKMLKSLGKGTGDFKQFENLSKQFNEMRGNIENVKKSLGTLNADKGMKNILTAINSIDSSLTTLTANLKGITSINTGGAEKEMKDLASAGDKVADSMERAAQAKKKLAETDLSSGGSTGKKVDKDAQKALNTELQSKLKRLSTVEVRNASGDGLKGDVAEAKQLRAEIEKLSNNPILSQTQVQKAKSDLEAIDNKVKDIQATRKVANERFQWDESVNQIREYINAQSKLNDLVAKNTNGKNNSSIESQIKKVESLKTAAESAHTNLENLSKDSTYLQRLGVTVGEATESLRLMGDAAKGSAESFDRVIDAYSKQVKKYNDSVVAYGKQKPQSENYQKAYKDLQDNAKNFEATVNRIKSKGFLDESDIADLKEYTAGLDAATNSLKNMSAAEKGAKEPGLSKVFKEIAELRDKYSGMGKEFKRELDAIEFQFKKAGDSLNLADARKQLVDFEAQLIRTGNNSKSLFDVIKNKAFYGLAGQIANMVSLYDVINVIKQAASEVVQLNTDITNLAKVSEQSVKQIYSDFSSYADIAKEMGGTISDTISATTAWAKNGYNIPDSKELARVSLLYKNVGDDITIDEANESLVSTLQGYKLAAKDAEHIIDVFNEVSNNEAISSAGIGEALQRSAASFNAANTSLEQSVALVTATNSVLQDPEKVGCTYIADLYSNVMKIKVAISVNVQRWIRPSKDLCICY